MSSQLMTNRPSIARMRSLRELEGVRAGGETTADDDGIGDDLAVAFPGDLVSYPTGPDKAARTARSR